MTKQEFMSKLKKRLNRLPHDEYNDAVQYYEQYFEDAEDEGAAIAALGTPEQVATKIFADFAGTALKKKSAWKTVWIVILAIFAAPIGLPIAIALGGVALALVIAGGAVVFAFAVSGAAVIASGVFGAILSFAFVFSHFPTTLFFIGFGLIAASFGVAFCTFAVWLAKITYRGLLKLFGGMLRRVEK